MIVSTTSFLRIHAYTQAILLSITYTYPPTPLSLPLCLNPDDDLDLDLHLVARRSSLLDLRSLHALLLRSRAHVLDADPPLAGLLQSDLL